MTFHHFSYTTPELNLEFEVKNTKSLTFIFILWLKNMSGLNLGQYYLDLWDFGFVFSFVGFYFVLVRFCLFLFFWATLQSVAWGRIGCKKKWATVILEPLLLRKCRDSPYKLFQVGLRMKLKCLIYAFKCMWVRCLKYFCSQQRSS